MTSDALKTQPLTCIPGAIPQQERPAHFALARRLLRSDAVSRRALANGYEIRFSIDVMTDVALFVSRERLCCPFLRFDLAVEPGAAEVTLRMTGPEGAREALDAELGISVCESECGCHGT
jgi:hypothetical protein